MKYKEIHNIHGNGKKKVTKCPKKVIKGTGKMKGEKWHVQIKYPPPAEGVGGRKYPPAEGVGGNDQKGQQRPPSRRKRGGGRHDVSDNRIDKCK